MTRRREKGKIPHSEWPAIVERHRSGHSFASIARDYGCTAPAIRYIVQRFDQARVPRAEGKEHGAPKPPARRRHSTPPTPPRQDTRHIEISLHERVTGDIASFLVAFETAVIRASAENLEDLRDATDRLMRTTARTRIEVERLLASGSSAEDTVARPPVAEDAFGA